MALFPEVNTYFKGRTHTQLVVSEGNAPAEKYIPSAEENAQVKFEYAFGPEGNQGVVIPKGKAVSIVGVEYDYETEKYVPAIQIADGTDNTKEVIGLNHHNVYQRRRDRFSGNQPTVITREYIELPLFASKQDANAIKFGAAWAPTGSTPTDVANAIIGKKIGVDENGNLTVATESFAQTIGTCYGVDTNVPPAGYLQYFMEMSDNEYLEFIKQQSYAPSPGRAKDADWNDIGTYPAGTSYLKDKHSLIKSFQAGIPYLTDGYFKARTEKTYKLSELTLKVAGHVTVTENFTIDTATDTVISVAAANKEGAALFISIPDKLAKDALKTGMAAGPEFSGTLPSDVKVTVGGVQTTDFHIDYTNNMIVVYLSNITADLTNAQVLIDATVLANQIPGIPTGWDFQGAFGAARILLQK